MGEVTKIAWCDHTFNPWVGCTKVSPGCGNCYAESYDKRVGGGVNPDGVKRLRWGKGAQRVLTSAANWREPLAWDREAEKRAAAAFFSPGVRTMPPRPKVFCSSLADVFDAEVPQQWRVALAALIEATPHLDWLLLTKRPEHFTLLGVLWSEHVAGTWPRNVWLGVTVENQAEAERRIPLLLAEAAAVRFLSCEPLLEAVDLSKWLDEDLNGFVCDLDWVIVGGESGAKARPFDLAWARTIVQQVRDAGRGDPKVFVKQLGARPVFGDGDDATEIGPAGAEGRLRFRDRAGADPAEWPEDLRVREFPEVCR